MGHDIKLYEVIYRVETKSGKTYDLPEQTAVPMRNERLKKDKQCVCLLWDDAVDGYQITWFYRKEIDTDVHVFIQNQPKNVRDKLERYAEANKISRNNKKHVQNVLDAIHCWEL